MEPVSVVIPTVNEAENIAQLIAGIEEVFKSNRMGGEIIVVDDKSADGTAEKARELNRMYGNIKVVEREARDGLGNALKRGVREASNEAVVFMDADLSHDPGEMPKLLKALEACDVVVGSRFLRESRLKRGLVRKVISGAYNIASRSMLGIRVSDVTSGYRAFRRRAFYSLNIESAGPEIHSELVVKAVLAGLRVGEVPVGYVDRARGRTKLNYLSIGPGYTKVMLNGFLTRLVKILS